MTPDEELRTLERAWTTTGSQDDLARLIAARRRFGLAVPRRLLDARRTAPKRFQSEAGLGTWYLDEHDRRILTHAEIPETHTWGVSTWGRVSNAQAYGPKWPAIVDEVRKNAIPGFATARIGDAQLAMIATLAFRYLELDHVTVTDRGLAHLAEQHQLETFIIHSEASLGAGLGALAGLPALSKLVIRSDLEAGSGQWLGRLAQLTGLRLGRKPPGGGLAFVASLRALESLAVLPPDADSRAAWTVRSGVDDADVARFAKLPELRGLDVSYARALTDKGLAALESAAKLERLALLECSGVTAAGVARLRAALPRCEVAHQVTERPAPPAPPPRSPDPGPSYYGSMGGGRVDGIEASDG